MRFTWDPVKSERNLRTRGLSLADAALSSTFSPFGRPMREKRNGTGNSSRAKTPVRLKESKSPTRGRTDWARVDATTDVEIAEQIRQNPDDVEFTDEMFAHARWVMPVKKVPISFRVDPDVLAFFKAAGTGYQSRMNAVLRGYMRGKAGSSVAKSGKTKTG